MGTATMVPDKLVLDFRASAAQILANASNFGDEHTSHCWATCTECLQLTPRPVDWFLLAAIHWQPATSVDIPCWPSTSTYVRFSSFERPARYHLRCVPCAFEQAPNLAIALSSILLSMGTLLWRFVLVTKDLQAIIHLVHLDYVSQWKCIAHFIPTIMVFTAIMLHPGYYYYFANFKWKPSFYAYLTCFNPCAWLLPFYFWGWLLLYQVFHCPIYRITDGVRKSLSDTKILS